MITLPQSLASALTEVQLVKNTASQLRANYERNKSHEQLHNVYLASRFPATYAAILSVLKQLPTEAGVASALDVGCGPGVGLWALSERFSTLKQYTGVDADSKFLSIAHNLSEHLDFSESEWINGYYPAQLPNNTFDLVLASYTFNENKWADVEATLNSLWQNNVGEYLVLLEPGTPKGFARMKQMREYLIQLGAYIYAPCMGEQTCPMPANDWCHFSVRLQRELFQKNVKDGVLPYEDEKYSYLIATKQSTQKSKTGRAAEGGRIIKKPIKRSGHYVLDVCENKGLSRVVISKSDKEQYKLVKKLEWGDKL